MKLLVFGVFRCFVGVVIVVLGGGLDVWWFGDFLVWVLCALLARSVGFGWRLRVGW